MTPRFQKLALLAHSTLSVGWLGAVVAYLALAIAGFTGRDAQMARAAYLSMELIGWFVVVPLSLATLLSGLIQLLGTRWGLFRHWWLVVKFLLTIVAITILLLHMRGVSRASRMTAGTMLSSADFGPQLVHVGGGVLVLLAASTLSVFKPWGLTPYGRRRASRADLVLRPNDDARPLCRPSPRPMFANHTPPWGRSIGFHALALALLFVIRHLTGLRHP